MSDTVKAIQINSSEIITIIITVQLSLQAHNGYSLVAYH